MNSRSRANRFRKLSRISPKEVGIPRARARELILTHAWNRIAGDAVSRRASAVRLRGGILDVEVADARWIEPLRRVVPTLASRLAAEYPELGVRRFRLREEGDRKTVSATDIRVEAEHLRTTSREESSGQEPNGPVASEHEDPSARLARARDRYLARNPARDPSSSR